MLTFTTRHYLLCVVMEHFYNHKSTGHLYSLVLQLYDGWGGMESWSRKCGCILYEQWISNSNRYSNHTHTHICTVIIHMMYTWLCSVMRVSRQFLWQVYPHKFFKMSTKHKHFHALFWKSASSEPSRTYTCLPTQRFLCTPVLYFLSTR